MRIGARFCMTALAAVLGAGVGLSSPAFAQESAVSGPISTSVPGPTSAPQSSAALPAGALPIDSPVSSSSSSSIEIAEKAPEPKKGKGQSVGEGSDIPAPSPKVPESVRNVVKHLNTATQDVTLEDLNSAREAVVKLDVLIDIEKRLNDLTTLRKEREEKNVSALAGAIPASALGLSQPHAVTANPAPVAFPALSSPTMPNFPSSMPGLVSKEASFPSPLPIKTSIADYEVVRIAGAGGHYWAMVKGMDGKTKRVRVGDKLSDGSRVESISRTGLTLSKDAKTQTIQVRDVTQVFGSR